METVISCEHVSFRYQKDPILQDVSFTVNQGEFLGIIGPNGGGKTTLLKLIMGFLTPSEGQIQIFGAMPNDSGQRLAYVPQNLRFDKQFPISVIELVLSGRLSHLPWYGLYSPRDHVLAHEALEYVGLADFKNQPFGKLSGGQMQRTLIARALVSKPQILLLDEPTASVDAQAEADIYALLTSLKGQMTILMVTHDLKATIDLVGRVLCVQRSITAYTPQEVCEHFAMGLYHPPLLNLNRTPGTAS